MSGPKTYSPDLGGDITIWRCSPVKGIHGRRLYLRGEVGRCLKRRLIRNGYKEERVGIWTWFKEWPESK